MSRNSFTNLLLLGASCTALVAGILLIAREMERRRELEGEIRQTVELPFGDGTTFLEEE